MSFHSMRTSVFTMAPGEWLEKNVPQLLSSVDCIVYVVFNKS